VFDGGARDAARAGARANADIAAANYRQAVLTAFQEVEDNLAATQALQREAALQEQALEAAHRNVLVTEAQYRAGTVSFLNLASAQAAELTAEATLLQLRQRGLAAVTTLLKNLAGRWASPGTSAGTSAANSAAR
jgi:outer membrane protein TolC